MLEFHQDQVHVLQQTAELKSLMTIIRDQTTSRSDFIFYSDRVIRMLVEEGLQSLTTLHNNKTHVSSLEALNHLPYHKKLVKTPTGETYEGLEADGNICGISIMRAGESMEKGLRDCCRSVRIGKILIQRDEETALPKLFYAKLPPDVSDRHCLLLDPMLATGGSAKKAIDVIISHGVTPERILFVNLVACPEGIRNLLSAYPTIKIITAEIDRGLDAKHYIVPGLGDFGDRYYV